MNQFKDSLVSGLLRQFGKLIRILRVRGSCCIRVGTTLLDSISSLCPNLECLDLSEFISIPCITRFPSNIHILSFCFPSCLSRWSSVCRHNPSNVLSGFGDNIECVFSVGGGNWCGSIWQFELVSNLQCGVKMDLECCLGHEVVGHVCLSGCGSRQVYSVNMLFRLAPRIWLGKLSIQIRCATKLAFGSGCVQISHQGRMTLIKSLSDTKWANPTVPSFR